MNSKYKHDYASLGYKLYNKIWGRINPPSDRRRYWLYRAWYHMLIFRGGTNRKEQTQYLTQRSDRTSGIGVNFENSMCGYHMAEVLNLQYAYMPLPDKQLADMLALGEGEVNAEKLLQEGYRKVRLPYFFLENEKELNIIRKMIASYSGQKVVFFLEDKQSVPGGTLLQHRAVLQNKFWNASVRDNDPVLYDDHCLNIALHIRRGDIGELEPNSGMDEWWLDNTYYIKLLDTIIGCPEYKDRKAVLYLISEGNEMLFSSIQAFADSRNIPLKYILNEEVALSWLYMIKADILLIGSSSFSYNAALFNKGIIISPRNRFVYPQDKRWLVAKRDGSILQKV